MTGFKRHRKGRLRAPFFACLFAAVANGPATADETAPVLSLPVDCILGEGCYIQQYVDRDPGPGSLDYACGTSSNDGHKGTDFAVPTEADMARGIAVLAAAGGIVQATRDGMADIRQGAPDAPDVADSECGNGVLIDHGAGWETQYCHLRQDSVRVAPGDVVERGAILGLIGMSGMASFPHVHVEIRKDDMVVDPFAPEASAACGLVQTSLWDMPLPYLSGGPIAAGIADALPTLEEVQAGLAEDGLLAVAGAVVLWVALANVQEGDAVIFEITGPDGPFASNETIITRTQPYRMEAFGRRAPQDGLSDGTYTGRVLHKRGATIVGRRSVRADLP